jgi:hypothetical protein
MQFGFCTMALQPIKLPDREFDFLAVPVGAESRFHGVGAALIDASTESGCPSWVRAVELALLERDEELLELTSLGTELGALGRDPAVLPNLARISNFDRSSRDLASVLRTLDVLEALSPRSETGLNSKRSFISQAVELTTTADATKVSFDALSRLSTALKRQAFSKVSNYEADHIAAVARELAKRDIDGAISWLSSVVEPEQTGPSISSGIASAIAESGRIDPLLQLPPRWQAALVLANSDLLSLTYQIERGIGLREFVATIVEQSESQLELMESIQQRAVSDRNSRLLEALYSSPNFDALLRCFEKLPEELSPPSLLFRAAQMLAQRNPRSVLQWSKDQHLASVHAQMAFALTAPVRAGEGEQLLGGNPAALCAFIERATAEDAGHQLGQNIVPAAIRLLKDKPNPQLVRAVKRLVEHDYTFALSPSELQEFAWISKLSFGIELLRRSILEAVYEFLRNADIGHLQALSSGQIRHILDNSVAQSIEIFVYRTKYSRPKLLVDLERELPIELWNEAGDALFRSLRDSLSHSDKSHLLEVAGEWRDFMLFATQLPFHFSMRLHFLGLFVALEHPDWPVSEMAVVSFGKVHKFLCSMTAEEERAFADVLSFIPWTSWDKGKYVRKRLCHAFVEVRKWPAADFMRASDEPELLRKLVKRARETRGGQKFLQDLIRESDATFIEAWKREVVSRAISDHSSEWT